MFLLRTHPARAAEMRYKMKLMTKRGADKPNPIAAILKFSFFSHLISPNTTGRQYVTSCYYCCSSFLLLQNKNLLLQKSTASKQESKQQEKADETKDRHTHTQTQKRELERRQQQEFTAHTGVGGGGEAGRQAGKRDGRS
jgi:hypothetical protein